AARGRQASRRRRRRGDRRRAGGLRSASQARARARRQSGARRRDPRRMNNPYTRGLAQFASALEYDRLPREVRERLKLLILDALGCALYGAELEWCRILRRTLASVDKSTACAIWGTRERLGAPHAALANGTQVQSFELDDVHRAGVLHVGAVVLPALIAIAETRRNVSGPGFLAAPAAGYEVGPPARPCIGPAHPR